MVDGMIKINGKEYFLKYPINALIEMKAAGLDVMKMEEEMLDLEQMRTLFYYGLQKIHRDQIKTVLDAGELMSDYLEGEGSIDTFSQIVSRALIKSLGATNIQGK